jgi:hypothetical protein
VTAFHHGDRIRYATTDDDGFPVVRYGFVGGTSNGEGPIVVMLDGEISGDVVSLDTIQPVHISNVTLTLEGTDLLDDPTLRQGLVNLWAAEAETAGLQISQIEPMGTGIRDSTNGYTLAELSSAGAQYVLRASLCPSDLEAIVIHADHP